MTSAALRGLASRLPGEVRFDEPLAPYTTYRIGGAAAALVMPDAVDGVVAALRFAQETGTRWLALGLGSNVLIADRGFDGIVIRLGRGLDGIEQGVAGDSAVWRVGGGLPTPVLARRAAKAGLGGVHRLIGVPGTVGGGVFMNAGAHGQDFSQVVSAVDVVEGDGTCSSLPGEAIRWRYRGSGLEDRIVVSALLRLTPGDPREYEDEVQRHLRWRRAGTPFNEPCCGSVFRNPELPASVEGPRTAGQIIDALGFKGFRIGGAEVSRLHANYIVNVGNATASDVLAVIDAVRSKVLAAFGIELRLEVKVIE